MERPQPAAPKGRAPAKRGAETATGRTPAQKLQRHDPPAQEPPAEGAHGALPDAWPHLSKTELFRLRKAELIRIAQALQLPADGVKPALAARLLAAQAAEAGQGERREGMEVDDDASSTRTAPQVPEPPASNAPAVTAAAEAQPAPRPSEPMNLVVACVDFEAPLVRCAVDRNMHISKLKEIILGQLQQLPGASANKKIRVGRVYQRHWVLGDQYTLADYGIREGAALRAAVHSV
eukprot:TRINITY_DN1687_c0_g1_i1.p2 TRINITY_DN1687_c0_g1~~TRINITY_DN1687_c0_g1_i1.p2  ORF type:complete len:235 (+),score=80.47 TRINITY_DN1687_c0_g1_i1:78-782(+)